MITDLEKTFFDTFGIKPKFDRMLCDNDYQCNGECNNCEYQEDDNKHKFYPQITDRILLELMCIDFTEHPYRGWGGNHNLADLKEFVLSNFIDGYMYDLFWDKEETRCRVCALFMDGSNENI